MNRRTFFLECFNHHQSTWLRGRRGGLKDAERVARAQDVAWGIPEEAVPATPGTAALELVEHLLGVDMPEPEWLAAHRESERSRGKVAEPF